MGVQFDLVRSCWPQNYRESVPTELRAFVSCHGNCDRLSHDLERVTCVDRHLSAKPGASWIGYQTNWRLLEQWNGRDSPFHWPRPGVLPSASAERPLGCAGRRLVRWDKQQPHVAIAGGYTAPLLCCARQAWHLSNRKRKRSGFVVARALRIDFLTARGEYGDMAGIWQHSSICYRLYLIVRYKVR
jgi:hypothetical protein